MNANDVAAAIATDVRVTAARDLATVAALLVTSLLLVRMEEHTLASTALGGALAFAVPHSKRVPAQLAIALGLAFGGAVALAGCSPSELALAHKVTCDAAGVICAACTAGGSSP